MEKKEIKISLIVTAYNVAEYLRRCLDSCVYQTLQDIEVIIVNDCSPDKRDGEIMVEYALRFPNKVRIIQHHENLGLGAARNTGIRAAVGEFVQFVDSDDYIDLMMCEKLYTKVVAERADMVICNIYYLTNGILYTNWNEYRNIDSNSKIGRLGEVNPFCAVRLIIKRSLLLENDLLFPEGIFYEDFSCCLWHVAASKLTYVPEKLYYYIQRAGSICNATDVQTKYQRFKDIFKCIRFIFNTNFFQSLPIELKDATYVCLFNSFIFSVVPFIAYECPDCFNEWFDEFQQISSVYHVSLDNEIFDSDFEIRLVKKLLLYLQNNESKIGFIDDLRQYCALIPSKAIAGKLLTLKKKRITIWGAGKRGQRLAGYLTQLDIAYNITDKNPYLCATKVGSATVTSWEEIETKTDLVIVSALNIHKDVITEVTNPNIAVLDFNELINTI